MADSNFRGPVNSMGSLEVQAGNTATIEPFDGPSASYQGYVIPDPRFNFNKDAMLPGRTPGFAFGPMLVVADNIPLHPSGNIPNIDGISSACDIIKIILLYETILACEIKCVDNIIYGI